MRPDEVQEKVEDFRLLQEADSFDKYLNQRTAAEGLKYIQTVIKSATGIGKPITINFHADLNLKDLKSPLKYDWRACGDEIVMIRNNQDRQYCYK